MSVVVWIVAFSLGQGAFDDQWCGEYRNACRSFFKDMQNFSYFPYLKSADLLQNAPSIISTKPFLLLYAVTPPIIFYGPITWFAGCMIWMMRNYFKNRRQIGQI